MSDVLEELVTKFTYDVDQAGLNKYLRSQDKINRNTKTMIGLNSTLSKVMRGVFVGAGAVLGVKSLVSTYRNLDLMRRSIEGLTQSTEDWQYLTKEAFRTATNIEVVAKGYRNFYSAASMAGVDKAGIQNMYSDILQAGRAVGATQPQIQGALLALEQMFSKGRVSMEELRRQLGNALPGAFEVAAKAMGVTSEEFNKLIKKGVQATDLVPKFTAEYRKTFEKSFPAAMKSLDAAIVNLDNSWKLFQYDLMTSGAGEEIAKFLVEISRFLQSPAAKSVAEGIGKALQAVVKSLEFIVKHWKMILFLWGVNTFMGGIRSLYNLRQGIVALAEDIAYGKHSLGGALNNIVYALSNIITTGGGVRALIKSIGTALIPLGRSMLWLTAIAAVIYGIYLVIEDIFTYINHPEWDSFTKDLITQFPIINSLIEDIKTTFDEMRPIMNDFHEIWVEMGTDFLHLLKDCMPLFKEWIKYQMLTGIAGVWMLSFIIKGLEKLIELLSRAAKGWKELTGGNLLVSSALSGGNPLAVSSMVSAGLLKTWTNEKNKPMVTGGYLRQLGMADYVSAVAGGYNLNKVLTDNKTVHNTFNVYGQNRTDAQMLELISKAVGGHIDSITDILSKGAK